MGSKLEDLRMKYWRSSVAICLKNCSPRAVEVEVELGEVLGGVLGEVLRLDVVQQVGLLVHVYIIGLSF